MHEVLALFLKAFLFASRLPVSAHIHLMDYFRFAEEKPLQAHLAYWKDPGATKWKQSPHVVYGCSWMTFLVKRSLLIHHFKHNHFSFFSWRTFLIFTEMVIFLSLYIFFTLQIIQLILTNEKYEKKKKHSNWIHNRPPSHACQLYLFRWPPLGVSIGGMGYIPHWVLIPGYSLTPCGYSLNPLSTHSLPGNSPTPLGTHQPQVLTHG